MVNIKLVTVYVSSVYNGRSCASKCDKWFHTNSMSSLKVIKPKLYIPLCKFKYELHMSLSDLRLNYNFVVYCLCLNINLVFTETNSIRSMIYIMMLRIKRSEI